MPPPGIMLARSIVAIGCCSKTRSPTASVGLAERFKQTQAVGLLKAEHSLPPADPEREAKQIERLEDLAKQADLDPVFAKEFLNFIIAEVINHHKKHQK